MSQNFGVSCLGAFALAVCLEGGANHAVAFPLKEGSLYTASDTYTGGANLLYDVHFQTYGRGSYYGRRYYRYRYPYRHYYEGYRYYYNGYPYSGGLVYHTPSWDANSNPRGHYFQGHVDWCRARYRSYNPQTDTFLGYDGYRHYCYSPYN